CPFLLSSFLLTVPSTTALYTLSLHDALPISTLQLLERQGLTVEFPEEQTCCGQPMANAGLHGDARPLAERFLRIFEPYDYVVSRSEERRVGKECRCRWMQEH